MLFSGQAATNRDIGMAGTIISLQPVPVVLLLRQKLFSRVFTLSQGTFGGMIRSGRRKCEY